MEDLALDYAGSRGGVVFANRAAADAASCASHEEVVARQRESEGSSSPLMKLALTAAPVAALYSPTPSKGGLARHRAARERFWA